MFYGYNRARFPTAVPVGSNVRMRADVVDVVDLGGGEQLTVDLLIEIDGTDRPACVRPGALQALPRQSAGLSSHAQRGIGASRWM